MSGKYYRIYMEEETEDQRLEVNAEEQQEETLCRDEASEAQWSVALRVKEKTAKEENPNSERTARAKEPSFEPEGEANDWDKSWTVSSVYRNEAEVPKSLDDYAPVVLNPIRSMEKSVWGEYGGAREMETIGATSLQKTKEWVRTEVSQLLDEKLATLKVYVLESEITQAQGAVKSIVEQATF